jgi:two-component sensor histidine kinase
LFDIPLLCITTFTRITEQLCLRTPKPISYLIPLLIAGLHSSAQQEIALQNTRASSSINKADTAEVNRLIRLSSSYVQADLDSVYYFSQQAMTMARQLNYQPGIAQAYLKNCLYHRMKGNTSLALQDGLKGLEIFERTDNKMGIAHACEALAQTYKETAGGSQLTDDLLTKGVDYARQAVSIYEGLRDSVELPAGLNVLGIIYRDRGKIKSQSYFYDSAYNCYTRAIDIIKRNGKGIGSLGRLYNNISQVYLEHKKDFGTALQYSLMAVDYNKERNNINSLTHNYTNISDIYRRMKMPGDALDFAKKATDLALYLNSPTRIANGYGQLYVCYKDMKQYDSALHYFVLSDRIADSFANLSKTQQIAEMQTRFETVKKESEIQRLNIVNSDKNTQISYLVTGLLLFVLLAGAMIWLYRRLNNQKQLISLQSKQMEVMMKELHHRVKNNLQIVSSLLSLQTYRLKDEESIAAIRESQQRVQAMSFIHQRLYKTDELTMVNVKEYITDLSESLLASYGYDRHQFNLQINVENEMLDVDKALPIGLIVNEIVTNAFKYAYKNVAHPSLQIDCRENGNDINLSIKDNGAGMDEQVWKQTGGSFGKQLVSTLCRQLRAKQSLEVNKGTRFHFVIPKNVAA